MSKLVKVIQVLEKTVIMQVSAATITFGIYNNEVVDVVRMPPPRECYVPQNLLWEAKKQAKAILLGKKTPSPPVGG
ncbi:MAG TPA: hypothetical protein VJH05_01955 [Candidatus Paceibacterota bacterium]